MKKSSGGGGRKGTSTGGGALVVRKQKARPKAREYNMHDPPGSAVMDF